MKEAAYSQVKVLQWNSKLGDLNRDRKAAVACLGEVMRAGMRRKR